jgi:hypothetical protein
MAWLIAIISIVHSIEIKKYEQLLQQPDYMADLPSLVSRCLAGERETNRLVCDDAEYVSKVSSGYEDLAKVTGATTSTAVPPIATLSTPSGTFERVFLDYIRTNKPLKGTLEQKLTIDELFKKCTNFDIKSTNFPLKQCEHYPDLLGSIIIPSAGANNYLFRLNESTLDPSDFDYVSGWPVISTVNMAQTPVVEGCPQNMHMLMWGATRPLRARVFPAAASAAFNPVLGSPTGSPTGPPGSPGSTAGPDALPMHVVSYTGSGYPRITAALGALGVVTGNYTNSLKFPKFAEVELATAEEVLFVPNDHLLSLYPSGFTDKDVESLRNAVQVSGGERVRG